MEDVGSFRKEFGGLKVDSNLQRILQFILDMLHEILINSYLQHIFLDGNADLKGARKSTENNSLDDLSAHSNKDELITTATNNFPPRDISDVESRLLNLAKEKPIYRRRKREDSSTDNESPDKYKDLERKRTLSPVKRYTQSPTRRSRSPSTRKSISPYSRRSRTPYKKSRSPGKRSKSRDKRRTRSPDNRRSRSPKKYRSRSPKRRSRSKDRRRSHSRSRSTERSRAKYRKSSSRSPRRRRSRSSGRRRVSRSRSNERRRRSRSISNERRRRSRSRSRAKRRSRSRSSDRRRRGRGRRYSRSRSPSPMFTSKWGQKPSNICRAVLPAGKDDKRTREVTTEDVEKRLAQHMKTVQQKAAEEAKKINLPGYLNPAMVNVHQFKQVQDKRKLLWSKAKEKKEGGASWAGAFEDQNNDEKFRRLMGIQENSLDGDTSKIQESRKVLDELEKEYEKSRAFQLSRGAGGVTGIGLGFGGAGPPQ